jgi:hypothetical protein
MFVPIGYLMLRQWRQLIDWMWIGGVNDPASNSASPKTKHMLGMGLSAQLSNLSLQNGRAV